MQIVIKLSDETYKDIKEEALVTFSDNPTNGDVIKALFPNSEAIFMLRNVLKTDIIKIENEAFLVDENWWNAPYKKESED